MEYSKQLIQKAKYKLCRICYKPIEENDADTCEFQYSVTGSRKEVFVHNKCWNRACGKKVVQ